MKRDHHQPQVQRDRGRGGETKKEKEVAEGSSFFMSTSKPHNSIWEEEQDHNLGGDGGMDELLAVLGYKVRSSDMADVAYKLEQLEMVMGSAAEDGVISHLSYDTVHYNPSHLSSWLQSMLSEFHTSYPPPDSTASTVTTTPTTLDFASSSSCSQFPDPTTTRSHTTTFLFDDDLRAIPGAAACAAPPSPPPSPPPPPLPPRTSSKDEDTSHPSKRFKSSNGDAVSISIPSRNFSDGNNNLNNPESTRPVVLVDSQETGVRLVHTLMACAEAIQQDNFKLADALVKHVGLLAVSQVGAMKKVATYFAEALARRIYRIYPQDTLHIDILQMHFYESCPYLKFAHFTANQAILEAFATATRVHVIDFGLKQGMQWPALMQALALRPGGPPAFRLTGIGPPQPDNTDALQQVGWKLAQLAETIGVDFEFRGFVANSLADLEPSMLDLRLAETVAVNSVFELHSLLARPGAIDKVLNSIKAMRPKIVTLVEQEANHNGLVFLDRFTEALHYYSSLFDSLEGSGSEQDVVMSEMYLGRQICNLVACEGVERVERHERLENWRRRMGSSGFEAVHLGSNAFKQASMLLALFAGGDGYRVEENNGCLMLGWHTRPLIATSAWQLPEATTPMSDLNQ